MFFFYPKRPTTSSSSQSTISSTFSALPQADRRWAHQGGRGHARADHLGPPPAGAARPPPSAMRQADGQWREPLVLEEEHELDRDHREQRDEDMSRCAAGLGGAWFSRMSFVAREVKVPDQFTVLAGLCARRTGLPGLWAGCSTRS